MKRASSTRRRMQPCDVGVPNSSTASASMVDSSFFAKGSEWNM